MKIKELASPANNHHYNKNLRQHARDLRNNSTKAEIVIWENLLKNGYLRGYQFLRQRPVLNYIKERVIGEVYDLSFLRISG